MTGQSIRKACREAGLKVSVKDTDAGMLVSLVSGELSEFIQVGKERLNIEIVSDTVLINPQLAGATRAIRQQISSGWVNPFTTRNIVWKCVNEWEYRWFKHIDIECGGMIYGFRRDDMEVNLYLDGEFMDREPNRASFKTFQRILLLSGPAEVADYSLIEEPHWGLTPTSRDRE